MKILFLVTLFITSLFCDTSSKKDMLIISADMGNLPQSAKVGAFMEIARDNGLAVDALFDSQISPSDREKLLSHYRVVMFDSLAGASSINPLLAKFDLALQGAPSDLVVLPISITSESPYRKNISLQDNTTLNEYWQNGGKYNFENFARYINTHQLKREQDEAKPPKLIPQNGIYHPKNPEAVFTSLAEYEAFLGRSFDEIKKHSSVIAIGMHKNAITANSLEHIDLLIDYLESKGAVVLPFYTQADGDDFVGEQFLLQNGKSIADVLITTQIMFLDYESLKSGYKRLDIPILHSLNFEGSFEEYEASTTGTSMAMMPLSYTIPENLGYIDPMVATTQNAKTKRLEPIEDQLLSLANKALNICHLAKMDNSRKRVAVMFYNYPHGVDNMGASFMNIPLSLELLFSELKKSGYSVEERSREWFETFAIDTIKAYYEKEYDEKLLANAQAFLFPLDEYESFLETIPSSVKQKMIDKWGEPSQSAMIVHRDDKSYFLIPAIEIGNVLLLPQPRRGDREKTDDENALWHNTQIAVNHSYLATYLYVQKHFRADAIVHFGTHGTQEWMPGKERGLSLYDDPMIVLGDIPIFYPYITNNVAEALQAKRRGRATLISHQTPPFAISGIYGELAKIMELISQYRTVEDGIVKQRLKDEITKESISCNIDKDVGYDEQKIGSEFDKYLSLVEEYILGTSKSAQPLGMHTFGTYPKEDHLITTVMQMLGKEFLTKADGEGYSLREYSDFNNSKAYTLVKKYAIDGKDLSRDDEEFGVYMQKAKEFVAGFKAQKEIINLLRALDGKFIETSSGGDSIRNPEILPTGRNLYGFDPNKAPTKAAYESGSKLMREFIEEYYAEHWSYPKKLTFNLWSLETMRHHGVLESQILYAMGVRPIWNEQGFSDKYIQGIALSFAKNYLPDFLAKWLVGFVTLPRVEWVLDLLPDRISSKPKKMIHYAKVANVGDIIDVEIIPYSELKRPRIDVTISATGLYRDTFASTMKLLAKAVDKVASLKEEHNYVYANAKALKSELLDQNLSEQDATMLSTVRIFANKSGYYGSGVNKLVDTQNFSGDIDASIARDYLEERGYYYGSDEKSWGAKLDGVDLYAKNLSGSDAVIFSRSSNLYGMLTSDDPYGYFGALSLAIRSIDGKNPPSYISNLRDIDGAKMQTTSQFMSMELRSRYFHPNWISEMRAEGYSGAQNVLDVVNNFWGWQVVDPDVVRDDQWQEFFEVYIKDKYDLDVKEWFESSSPDNLAQIMERMLEAVRLGYWQSDEATVEELKSRYKELAKKYNIKSYNSEFNKLLESDQVGGFGLAQARANISKAEAVSEATKQGQLLEQQKMQEVEKSYKEQFLMLMLLAVVLAGMLFESKKRLP